MAEKRDKTGAEDLNFFPGGVCLVSRDEKEKILAVNQELCNFYKCPSEEDFLAFTGGFYRGMLEADEYTPLAELYQRQEREGQGEPRLYHFLMQTKDRHFCRLEGLLIPMKSPHYGSVWSLHLIKNRIREEAVETDSVTGLMGRHAFYKKNLEMAEEDRKNGTLDSHAPVYINLTNFKLYNSNYGMAAGDALLRNLAVCLRRYFPDELMTHLSADNFLLLARRKHLKEKLTALARDFQTQSGDPSVAVKAGITIYERLSAESQKSARHSFDTAKIAADSIKKDASRTYAVYTEAMGRRLLDEAYVLRHFESALEKGYICVYYQPVVRTLTGKLCSAEALVRWEDPDKGTLSPGSFIPVLEKTRLIPKLDFYVLEEVARLLRFQLENERPIVPLSVNLSRVDFDMADPVMQVEDVVRRYQLPRSLIHIEITETALARDSQKMQKEIERFRKAGYECWLDDFGSGYSSLNVLQHFRFDEIKLDMSFQRNFNEGSRKILRSLVLMAKGLGIHTLAEGVETKEQADFLRSIGCEKIQGFYYSRPMPYEACHCFCYEQQLISESQAEALLMEKAGLVNIVTDVPLSVFWYDGKNQVQNLWENKAFRDTLSAVAKERKYKLGKTIALTDFPIFGDFRELLSRAVRSGREETLTYVDNGQYMSCKVQILAAGPGSYTGKAEMYDITFDGTFRHTCRLDGISRHLITIYDSFYLYHGRQDEMELISARHASEPTKKRLSRRQWMTLEACIHPDDRQRFLAWASPRALYRQAKASGRAMAVNVFRMRQEDGNFAWTEFDVLPVGRENEDKLLFCIKESPMEWIRDKRDMLQRLVNFFGMDVSLPNSAVTVSQTALLNAMKQSREIKLFWKDRKRRFLGASRAFLDYYDIHDEKEILGKTDEDMGWHVDEEPFRGIEEKVLKKGAVSRRALGKCIIRGRLRTIRASKVPLYDGNRIIGLIGYFEDLEQDRKRAATDLKLGLLDPETGLTGFRGLMLAGLDYYGNYKRSGEDFSAVLLHLPELEGVSKTYGEAVGRALMKKVSRLLSGICSFQKTLGHLGDGKFLFFTKHEEKAKLQNLLLRLSNAVHAIRDVQGRPVTLYLQQASAYGSEAGDMDGLIHLLSERLDEAEQEKYGQSIYIGDRIAFDREAFDTTDQNVLISRMDDYQVLYINKAGLCDLGLAEDYDYQGMKCHKLLCGLDYPCDDCPHVRLRQDRFYTRAYHNRNLGRDYLIQHILVPWRGQNCHLEMATNLRHYMEDEIKENELVFQEMAVNDALETGLRAADPDKGIQDMLARVGKLLECEKVCVFEERLDGTACNTYEWCRDGVPSTKAKWQQIPRHEVQLIYDRFDTNQVAIIENVRWMLRHTGQKRTHLDGMKSLISGHLTMAGRSVGFTEVINPSRKILKEASPLLATLTRFLAIMLRNRDNVRYLHYLSYADVMTGTGNRRAFQEYVRKFPDGETLAFIFGDMNGLKAINDHLGHKAGDKALCTIAEIMKELAGRDKVFRLGGDEFLMVLGHTDLEKANDFIRLLKKRIDACGISMAFGAAVHTTPIEDVDTLLIKADRAMYRDKKHPRA